MRVRLAVSAALLPVTILLVSSCNEASAPPPASEPGITPSLLRAGLRDTAIIELRDRARLLEDGRVMVTLRALCPEGFQVIEGPLTLTQGTFPTDFFGEGFFTNRCDGHWHWQRVPVFTAHEGGFQRGVVNASASLMIEDPATGEFLQADDNGVLTVR